MSADNGIYIAKLPDGYRAIHAQAIDNLDYMASKYGYGSPEHVAEVHAYFDDALPIADKDAAILTAHKMAEDYEILEYGVCYIGELPW